MESSLCAFLEWDTTHFGRRIARLESDRLTPAIVDEAFAWCAAERIDCLYFLAVADDAQTTQLTAAHGFQLVDIRMVVKRLVSRGEEFGARESVRSFCNSDLAALKAVARKAHTGTRFFGDPHFDREQCASLYEVWLERSCTGWADAVFTAQFDGVPVGYCTCHLAGNGRGTLGIVGLAEHARGKGLGQQMVSAMLEFHRDHGTERVQIVTQGRNTIAQRLYQRNGFLTESVMLWYHKWLSD